MIPVCPMIVSYSLFTVGKGLTIVASVIEGNYNEKFPEAQAAQQVSILVVKMTYSMKCIFI